MATLPETFTVTVDKGGGQMVELNLSKYSIRSTNCRIVSWDSTNGYTEEHTQANQAMPARTYRGTVTGEPNVVVIAVINADDSISAQGHSGSGKLWDIVGGQNVTTELGNGTSTTPTAATFTADTGTTVAAGQPGQYLPAVGLYRAHGVEDVPSQFYDLNGQNLTQTLAWLEYQWNIFDYFNTRDTKLSMELTEVIVRKDQFYTPEAGSGQFTTMLRNEWAAQGQNKRGFVHSWFPYNFTYAGGYASGNEFYGANHCISVNALYHEVAHNWRAQHYFYGRETMTGSHPAHTEMNSQRVLYTRQIQIDQDDGIEQISSYATNVHPRAYQDVASTLTNTAVNISPMENDYDANGDAISIKEFDTTTAQGGTVTESNGVLTYTPAAGYVGKDVIAYAVQDTAGLYTKNAIHIEVINQDIAAHWKLEETSGTSAADDTGHGHAATLVGADFTTDSITGPVGKAVVLGASDHIIGDASNLIVGADTEYPLDDAASNFFDPMDQSFTVATWFKLEPGTTSANLVSKRNSAALGYLFSASTTGGLSSQVRVWDGIESINNVSGGTIAEDTWYHAAMVINRTDNTLRIYLNGVEVGTASSISPGFNIFNGRADFTIGGGGALAVDDVQVYTKPLTAAELLAMRNAGEVPAGEPTPSNLSLNTPVGSDLSWIEGNASYQHDVYFGTDASAVAAATTASPEYKGRQSATSFDPGALDYGKAYFWRIDQVDGSTIIGGSTWSFSTAASAINENLVLHLSMDDADVQRAEGTAHTVDDVALPAQDFNPMNLGASQTGVIGQAADLSSASATLRSKSTSPVHKPATGGVTVSFWINTTSTESNKKIYDGGGAYFMRFINGDLQTVFDGSSGGALTFDTNINDGQWHHVVAHNDGAGTTTIYVDGASVGTQSESLYDIASLSRYFGIGSNYSTATSENLNASIDDFAVWERALSVAEITAIRTAGLAGKSFNDIEFVTNTSFEVANGFSGFTAEALTNLGSVTDNDGLVWTEVSDVKIWNRADLAPAGVQTMALGVDTSSSQLDIALPGTQLGVGTVSFDYASYSGGANNTFRLLYNDNAGSGWVEAWSTQVIGHNPSSADAPWAPVEVSINVPGNVDLRFETNGSRGAMFDNLKVTAAKVDTNVAPSFAADPINKSNAIEGVAYNDSLAGSATDADSADVLAYSKTSGPAWLIVAADGTLSGTPSASDVGANVFTISVDDGNGGSDTATLNITVDPTQVYLTSDFEGAAGTTIGGGWIEQINDSRVFNTNNVATQMVISQNSGELFAIVNEVTDTFVAGERYRLTWNGARATTSSGTLNFKAEIGTWDGTTFTPLATEEGALANVNLLSKVTGTPVYFTATATEAGQEIAVRLEVLTGSSTWVGFDDVQIENIGTNVAPVFAANPLNKANATEDAAYSASIGSDASDSDAGDSISYSKVSGPAWLVVAADGTLSGTPANADVGANAFTVRVTDAGDLTNDATLNITVDNVNDAPVANDNSGSIAEGASNGSALLTVAANDIDAGDSLTYAITAGNTGGAFVINNDGEITTAAGLDFETTNSYALTVTVTDTSNATDTATVTVTVTDDNEAPTANNNSGSVAENTSAGAVIATVTSSDPDANDSVSYAITAGNTGNAFAINSTTGVITTTAALDYETASNYNLTVTATDSGSLTGSATVTVSVTNVNEAPTANDATFAVAEDATSGAVVGTVTSSDVDANDSVSYAITAGNGGGEFAINSSTGEITTASALDYETTASYALTVTATDDGGLSDTATVTVTVTDVNEGPIGQWAFDETSGANAADSSVNAYDGIVNGATWMASGYKGGALSFDGSNDYVDLSAHSSAFSALNEGTVALWVRTSGTGAHALFTVSDSNDGSSEARFFVENGTIRYDFRDDSSALAEEGGMLVGPSINDGEWHHVAVTVDAAHNAVLYVDGVSVTTGAEPFYASLQGLNTVSVGRNVDSGGGQWHHSGDLDDLRVYPYVLDATAVSELHASYPEPNQAPVANDSSGNLAEDVAIGTAVVTVSATDPDAGDTLTYAITAGNTGGAFAINASTGAITTATALDYETTAQYVLTVTVTDDATPALSDTATITVNVTNVNEAPSLANSNGSDGEETVAYSGSIAGSATDPDAGDTLSYSKVSGPAWLNVAANGALSGTPAVGDDGANIWTTRVTDGGGLTADATFTINVIATIPPADPPSNPSIANGATGVDLEPVLTWGAATGADSYDIYFGTTAPGTFQVNQTNLDFNPGTLAANTTYFWRVDTVNGSGTTTGTVWSFTTGTGGPVTLLTDDFEDANLTGWTLSGNVTAHSSGANSGIYGARLKNSASMTTTVDTSAVSSVTLEYDRKSKNLDNGELLTIEWSADGSNWNTVETTSSTSWATTNVVLPAGAAGQAALQIRFSTNANRNNEHGYIDNITVTGN